MELKVVHDEDGRYQLKVEGQVVQRFLGPNSDPMKNLVSADDYKRECLMDLSDVPFIDSSGISWLLVHHKRFRQAGGKLVLHSLQPAVAEVIHVLRLNLVFSIAENEPEALAMAREES
jgi:anti-sigma B factor antagonist